MGYTTEFDGQFLLSPPPPAEIVLRLMDLHGVRGKDLNDSHAPDSWNQWELTRDRQHIQWDGGEKFYEYKEWLQYLIDHVLQPAGITLAGSVDYSGEEVTDVGVLTVIHGVVVDQKKAVINNNDLAELQEFKEFVLQSRYGQTLLREWLQQHD